MTDQVQQAIASATAAGQSPLAAPPGIIESIRKLQIQYAEIGVEIEKLDEKIEVLREERSDLSSKQSDVMQQIRMFEEAASAPDEVSEVDGVSIAEPRRPLPDIDFKRWEDAPITELGLSDIEGLGRAKRQKLLEAIPTIGKLVEYCKQASIRCMPLCEVLPKGVGKNTADAIEEKMLNWLDKNRGSYGIEDNTEKKDDEKTIPLEVDGTARAAKMLDKLSEASGGSGDVDGDNDEPHVDLASVDLEIDDDSEDTEEPHEPQSSASPDCDELDSVGDAIDSVGDAIGEAADVDERGPDRQKGRGRPKGSMDRTPRKRRTDAVATADPTGESVGADDVETPSSDVAEPTVIDSVTADEPHSPPDASEFMFPEDTLEYLTYRYGELLKTRNQPSEIHDMGIYESGSEAARRGWTLEDCNWAPGDNQDDWLLGFIFANGNPAADKKNEPSAID